jgi:polysaccharide biosynthesis transport protein
MTSQPNSLLGRDLRRRQPPRAPVAEPQSVLGLAGETIDPQAHLTETAAPEPASVAAAPPETDPQATSRHRHHVRPRPAPADDAWRPLIDIRTVLAAIADTRWVIGLLTVAGLALGILLSMGIPKYYYSTVELLIDPRDLKISERELLPSGLPYDASLALVENQTKIITSRRVMEGTVDKLRLADDPEFNGEGLGMPSPLTMLMKLIFGSDASNELRLRALAVESLYKAISVSREPKTFLVNLTVRSEVADKAALIANEIAAIYIGAQQDIQSGAAQRASGEIGGRLDALRADVEKAERAVEAYRSDNELFDANGKLISDDEIALVSTQLTQARQRVAELKARADSARQLTLDRVLSDGLPEGAASNLISELRRGYAGKVQQRDALSQKLGSQHPQLQTAEAEVASAARAIETELRRLSQTSQIELQRAVQTEQDLAASQARIKSRQSGISENLVQLRELEREAAARRSIYENFLLRAREAGEQSGITTANTSIVSAAVPAIRSYGTSRKLVMLAGLLGGLLAGLGLGTLRGIWRCIRDDASSTDYHEPAYHVPEAAPPTIPETARAPQRQPATTEPSPEDTAMFYPYPPMMHPMPQHAPQPMPQHYPQAMAPTLAANLPANMPMMVHPAMQPAGPYGAPYSAPYGGHYPPNVMPQPMHPGHYPQMQQMMYPPMMPQPMLPQPMLPQPMMQPYPVYVPVAAPQQQAPAPQPAPVAVAPAQPTAQVPPAETAPYDEIRGRLRTLRNGIANLAEQRDRLAGLR